MISRLTTGNIGPMNTFEQANEYDDLGWNVIPIRPNEKKPLIKWKDRQERRATKEELKRWFLGTRNNIGIVTGKISNLVVLDCDNERAIDDYYFKTSPSGVSVKTANGRHFYHSYTAFGNRANNGLDIRGDGGLVMAPPSIHPSGIRYEWDIDGPMTKFDPSWFEDTRRQVQQIITTASDSEAVERCRRYVRQIEGAVSGNGGHRQTFRAACKIRDFLKTYMSWEEALPLLREYNDRCDPPWSERELAHKLQDAWNS